MDPAPPPADAAHAAARRPLGPTGLVVILCAGAAVVGLALALLMAAAPRAPPPPELSEAVLRTLAHDPELIARGKALWGNCVGCHGVWGQGVKGPNLRDDWWLHGSNMRDICRSIRDGYPLKGMPSWGAAGITPDDLHALAAYVVSLHGQRGRQSARPTRACSSPSAIDRMRWRAGPWRTRSSPARARAARRRQARRATSARARAPRAPRARRRWCRPGW